VLEAEEPVSLVEIWIKGHRGSVDFAKFLQRHPELEPADEQVAYFEHLLDADGVTGAWPVAGRVEIDRDLRVAFFIHYLDTMRPLETPFGPTLLPEPTDRPARLDFVEYCLP
jgi:hypothetical protein